MQSISRHLYSSVSDSPFLFVDSESILASSVDGRAQQQSVLHLLESPGDLQTSEAIEPARNSG